MLQAPEAPERRHLEDQAPFSPTGTATAHTTLAAEDRRSLKPHIELGHKDYKTYKFKLHIWSQINYG